MRILKLNKIAKQMSDNLIDLLKAKKVEIALKKESEDALKVLANFKGFEGDYRYELGRVIGRLEAITKILYRLTHE